MSVVFDLIIIAIIALSIFIGYKQGLLKSLIKIVSFFIAIIVALTLYKPVSRAIINNTSIDDNIKNVIVERINIDNRNEDEKQEDSIQNKIQNKVTGTTEVAIDETANIITIKIIEIATLLGIFLIVRIVLLIITLITDLVSKLPVIKQANKLGGVIFGIVRGVIIVYTILAVVYLITPLLKEKTAEDIDKSIITKTLYNNNLILNIFI